MKRPLLILPATLLLVHAATAQQQFNAPQLLNPAMTGFTPADVRASLSFNSNLPSWKSPAFFTNSTFAADAPILKGKLPKGDAMGIGIFSTYSSASAGDNYDYNGKSIGLSVAYHKALGRKKDQYLSAGIQGAGNSFALNWNGEYASASVYTYKAGIMYIRPISIAATFYGGFSVAGAERSSLLTSSVYLGGVWNINKRFTLNATVAGGILPQAGKIEYGGYAFTAMGGYTLKPDSKNPTTIYLGGMLNYRDRLSPYVGIEKHGFRLALSPHMNTGSYSRPLRVNSYEISLLWLGHFKKHSDKHKGVKPFPRIY